MIHAALTGLLDDVPYELDPVFNIEVPTRCPGVPESVLKPRSTWRDPAAYDVQAKKLAQMFIDNFAAYSDTMEPEVRAAGPRF